MSRFADFSDDELKVLSGWASGDVHGLVGDVPEIRSLFDEIDAEEIKRYVGLHVFDPDLSGNCRWPRVDGWGRCEEVEEDPIHVYLQPPARC